jgi:hypothetical protein
VFESKERSHVELLILPRLLALAMLALGVGIVGAQATAVRVRAHLAPSPVPITPRLPEINGTAVGGTKMAIIPVARRSRRAAHCRVLRDGVVALTDSVTLADGDSSLILTGDDDQVPLDVLVINDTLADPGEGMVGLRVTHVAAMGATIEATQVDVCSQEGQIFHSSAAGLRYNRTTNYRLIPANTYDLKITRFIEDAECSGAVVIGRPHPASRRAPRQHSSWWAAAINRWLSSP